MKTETTFIILIALIAVVVAVVIINQGNSELGSEPEDILVERHAFSS